MILRPLITMHNRLLIYPTLKQFRNIRPTVKIGKDRFQVSIDVHQFTKDEIRVKALPEYVVIEGKQERKTKRGCIMRQFVRKFKLPDGCSPKTMKTELSPDGILTITAPRKVHEANFPCETFIPISTTGTQDNKETVLHVEPVKSKDPCAGYRDKPDNKKP